MKLFKAILFMAALVAIGGALTAFAPIEQARQPFDWIVAKKLIVQNATVLQGEVATTGAATFASTVDVTGAATFADTVDVTGASTFADTVGVTGATTLGSTLFVTGTSTLVDDLDMSNQPILNIGAAGTDFSTSGGLTLADDLNMSNQPIVNVGAAGTDFSTSGGLTLADDLDMSNQPILNIGVAGTDFGTDGSLTAAGIISADGGITVDTTAFSVADATGDTVISGTLTVSDTLAVEGGSDFNGAMNVDANVDADSISVAGNADLTTINNSGGDLAINDNVDITGTLTYGADDLYPLGYAVAGQQTVCGTTAEFTGTVEITPTGLTTVTYVIPIQITAPAATAVFLTASDPTTSTFVLSSWESDYTEGTSGVTAHWCAVGDQ